MLPKEPEEPRAARVHRTERKASDMAQLLTAHSDQRMLTAHYGY